MTNEITQRIEQINNGEVPQGYKKTKVGIVPSEWEIEAISSYIKEFKQLSNDIKRYPLYSSSRKGLIPQWKYFDKKEAVKTNMGYKVVPRGFVTYRHMSDDDIFHFNINLEKTNILVSAEYPVFTTIEMNLYYLITNLNNMSRFRCFCGAQKMGGTRTRLYFKNLKEYQTAIPPLPEQEKIAEILTTCDKVIKLKEKLIAEKQKQKKYLMQQLLTGKKRLKGFTEKWKTVKLKNYVFYQEGPGVRNKQYTSTGVKLLNVGNIDNNNLILDKTDKYISSEEVYGKYNHFLIDEGDLIIACSGIRVEYFDKKITFAKKEHLPLCMNTSTMRFKSLDKSVLNINYLFYTFQSSKFILQISGILTGSAQFNFGPTHIKYLTIKLLDIEEQTAIANILSTADKEIKLLEQNLAEWNNKKKSLMQLLLTGIVRVKI